jgi:4'-phosphopantetheinyl transferase
MAKCTATDLPHGAVEIVLARLDVEPDALDALVGLLPEMERQRARRFHFARDRRRFIVARARLRQLLAARVHAPPRSLRFSYGIHGKPVLARAGVDADWRFSVSHSADIALFAFCRGRDVGIDIEAVHAVQDADAIAAQYFSPREFAAYRALAPRDRVLGFFGGWTRTEALGKALGDGLHRPPACRDPSGWRLHSFSPLAGYVAALAVGHS